MTNNITNKEDFRYLTDEFDEKGRPNLDDETTNYIKDWFDQRMKLTGKNSYEETIPIREDGHLSSEERLDGGIPFLSNVMFSQLRRASGGKIEARGPDIEEFYKIIQALETQLPEFEFKIEVDPQERRWIKYEVRRKDKTEK